MKLSGVTSTIAIAWAATLSMPKRDQRAEDPEVRAVSDDRHGEEAEALKPDVPALVAERPETVPEVVVGDGNEEGDGGGIDVVPAGPARGEPCRRPG